VIALLDRRPIIVALAGPNGAGKSTFYRAFLESSGLRFVNADQLALQLKIDAYRAAEAADQLRERLVSVKESFIFETVFSDPVGGKLGFLQAAEKLGYTVVLFFIGVDGTETSRQRVAMRVQKGGHDVPTSKLESRYSRTIENLRRAFSTLSNVAVYDNSDLHKPYRLVAEIREGQLHISPPTPDWLRPLLP
jgi:predicted ABC-type ATPase